MKLYEFFNVPADKKSKHEFPNYAGQSQEEKEKVADDVFWYIIDQDDLHKEFVLPFVRDMKAQVTSPNFNRDRFTKKWMPMVSKGCKSYYKKEKLQDDPKDIFSDDMKQELCKKLCDKFIQEIQDDDYQIGDYSK